LYYAVKLHYNGLSASDLKVPLYPKSVISKLRTAHQTSNIYSTSPRKWPSVAKGWRLLVTRMKQAHQNFNCVDLLVLCYDASSKKKSRKECMKHWKKDIMKV